MFIGRIRIEHNEVVLFTLEEEQLILAVGKMLQPLGALTYFLESYLHESNIVIISGTKIGRYLNIKSAKYLGQKFNA